LAPVRTTAGGFARLTNDQSVVEPLMVPFSMIMVQELANAVPQRIFSEENHLIQATAFLNRLTKHSG
jgi:hypothetical protein